MMSDEYGVTEGIYYYYQGARPVKIISETDKRFRLARLNLDGGDLGEEPYLRTKRDIILRGLTREDAVYAANSLRLSGCKVRDAIDAMHAEQAKLVAALREKFSPKDNS